MSSNSCFIFTLKKCRDCQNVEIVKMFLILKNFHEVQRYALERIIVKALFILFCLTGSRLQALNYAMVILI